MQLFRYREDRLPVVLITILFCLDLLVFALASSLWQLGIWFAITLIPKICICSWNHHHQHLPTFYQRPLNRILELIYALHTGITTNAWVLHHNLGHHINYLDQSKDESGWKRRSGQTMGEIEYTFMIALTGYWRAFCVGRRHPKYQGSFLGMGLIVVLICCALLMHNWINAAVVFLLPMLIGYLTTCWHTYSHHAGLDSSNHFEASHNIMHRAYNLLTGNLGYHTAHHIKPGLHWSRLPQYHETIVSEIPAHLFVKAPLPLRWLPE